MTNDELARQYREAMTCDRNKPPDVAGWWMLRRASMDEPQIIWYADRKNCSRWLSTDCLFGRCPLPDPAACDDDEPLTDEWCESISLAAKHGAWREPPGFSFMIDGVCRFDDLKTRGDVRRVAKVFGVELREGK